MRVRVPAALIAAIALAACAKTNAAAADSSAAAAADSGRATAHAAADPAAVRHAIDSSNSAMSRALEHADAKTVDGMYASDAIGDFPGAPIANGSDAISKTFAQDFAGATVSDVKLSTDDVLTGGDLAVENGTFAWTITPKAGGKAEKQTGHYLTVWRHQPDGAWKIVRDYVTADPAQK